MIPIAAMRFTHNFLMDAMSGAHGKPRADVLMCDLRRAERATCSCYVQILQCLVATS